MVMPWTTIAQGAAKTISGIAKTKAKKKQNEESRRALIAQLTTRQKMGEDQRIARLNLGSSIMGNVPKTTAGGGVNTGVGLDPELVKQLGVERTYDFASTVPKDTTGAAAYLGAIMGDVADTLNYYPVGGSSAGPTPSSMLYDRGTGVQLPGGGPQTAPLYPTDNEGNIVNGSGGIGTNVSWEELFKQRGYGAGGDY